MIGSVCRKNENVAVRDREAHFGTGRRPLTGRPDHAERLPIVPIKHLPRSGDPVDAAVLPQVAKFDVELTAFLQGLPDGGLDRRPVVRVDELLEMLERASERAGGKTVERLEAVLPLEVAGADVPVPHSHSPGVECQP